MTEQNPEADKLFAELESQMAIAALKQRAEYAASIAILSGDILAAALVAGVPYSLAREMAADFWKAEMVSETLAALIRNAEEDDE